MLPWGWCQHQACHPQALGTCQPPVYQTSQPPVTAWPRSGEWGRDDRWRRCHSNQSLRQLRNKRKPSRTDLGECGTLLHYSLRLNPPVPTVCRRTGTPWPISGQMAPDPIACHLYRLLNHPWTLGHPSSRLHGRSLGEESHLIPSKQQRANHLNRTSGCS